MFLNLFKLYKKNGYSKRSPLEDFNTEVFAGILNLNISIKEDFIKLLELPEDDYEVKTQLRYSLKDRTDCIIDLVLIGENNVCFIENKVNSGEGWEQLDRYCDALETHFKERRKHLVYCTKFTDHKVETRFEFQQIRWYQIAVILEKYMDDDPYLLNYYNFLKHFNMAQKNTFSPEMIIAMENMKDTIETIKIHIENARPYFEEIFAIENSKFQEASTSGKDRVAVYFDNILPEDKAWTEILYCAKVRLVKLQTQIFIAKSHPQIALLKENIKAYDQEKSLLKLKFSEHPAGYLIYTDRKLFDLINDPEADDIIKRWFIDSFHAIADFVRATPELNWGVNVNREKNIFQEFREYLSADGYSSSTIDFYCVLAEKNIRAGYEKSEENFNPVDKNITNLKKMELLTYGDHGPDFKGKQSFRKFLNQKINTYAENIL